MIKLPRYLISQLSTITTYETSTSPPTPPRDSSSPTGLEVLGRYSLPSSITLRFLLELPALNSLRRFSYSNNFWEFKSDALRLSNHLFISSKTPQRQLLPQRVEAKQAKPTPLKLTKLTTSLHKIENFPPSHPLTTITDALPLW